VSPIATESHGVGKVEELSSDHHYIFHELASGQPFQITFRYSLTSQTLLKWDTVLQDNNLYIEVPNGLLPDASKDAFVALLEYAEEVLQCNHAVVCFMKDRVDRATLIRTFMFLGFYVAPPTSDLVLNSHEDYVYMVYNIN